MLLTICLTFVGATAAYTLLACFACWRVSRHLQGDASAMAVVFEHVVLPIFYRKPAAPLAASPLDPVPGNLGVACPNENQPSPAWRS